MRLSRLWVLFVLIGLPAAPVCGEILTYFYDNGLLPGFAVPVPVYSGCATPSGSAVANGQSFDLAQVPEGFTSWKTYDTNPSDCYFGWGATYPTTDLSRFVTGELRFWVYSTTPLLKVEIKDNTGALTLSYGLGPLIGSNLNRWVPIRIPLTTGLGGNLSGSGLSQVVNPFLFTSMTSQATFYIDNVSYVTPGVASPQFSVTIKNRSDNSTATQIGWSSIRTGSSWQMADQYLELSVQGNQLNWGVQLYTDNTNGTANPRYTGTVSSTVPNGGLVNSSLTTQVLPMAWEAVATTSPTLVAQDPASCPANGLACLWLFLEDHATFNRGNPVIFDGAAFVSADSNYGIHYAQGTGFGDPSQFGAAKPPNIIYLEANFQPAFGGTNYRTSMFRVEYYTQ
jgi:hypothetical protein